MMKLEVYLHFNGQAEEALNFYESCLNGEITYLTRYSEGPMPVAGGHKNRVMHANFKFGDNMLMLSDAMPEHTVNSGKNVSLSIGASASDIAAMEAIFNNLAQGGTITMPLQDTF